LGPQESRFGKLFDQINHQSHGAAKQHQLVSIVKFRDRPTRENHEAEAQPKGAFIHESPLLVTWHGHCELNNRSHGFQQRHRNLLGTIYLGKSFIEISKERWIFLVGDVLQPSLSACQCNQYFF
jgi:hypothetical protein